jgi:hypothetical protein
MFRIKVIIMIPLTMLLISLSPPAIIMLSKISIQELSQDLIFSKMNQAVK